MTKNKTKTIEAQGTQISVVLNQTDGSDYICITDIAKQADEEDPRSIIKNWIRNRNTIEFLGTWELINNPNFKQVEFDLFKIQSGSNSFTMSPQKWIKTTNAIGIISKSGRYGGTYAHSDIAFEFASWLSPQFKLYIIQDYQRLKKNESDNMSLEWNVKRSLTKVNYRLHTDAVKEHLIPPELDKKQHGFIYANEAELLNKVVFDETSKEWRENNVGVEGNIRDYVSVSQLVVLSNIEARNAELIADGMNAEERFRKLRKLAITQLKAFAYNPSVKKLEQGKK